MRVAVLSSLDEVAPEAWDALAGDDDPFVEHAFLSALERSGAVGAEAGWVPMHVTVWDDSELVGALPLYLKDHSYGEFIFDWAWADAAQRVGLPYYPKMVVAAPHSPVGGERFLLAPGEGDDVRDALLEEARRLTVAEPATGLHWLFVTRAEAAFLQSRGLAVRHTHQFHWQNEGYATFDDFLERFRSKRRNQIRRERRQLSEQGVTVRVLEG
ncbi:MAG: N-acetyltransferase, partial [Myxococcales bacterium]|nr:N-acetyltransferase [Myxococcales bacterium]